MATNQQYLRPVGGRAHLTSRRTSRPRSVRLPVVVLDFERARRERLERNHALLMVEAGLPGDRSHVTYDEIASQAREDERHPDPLKRLIEPLAASVDKAAATNCPGMVRATFDRIDSLFETLRRQLMARVPEPLDREVWGDPSIFPAYREETMADADADVAQAIAAARPDDLRAVEEARDKTLRAIERGRVLVTACNLTLSRGGLARGALVTK